MVETNNKLEHFEWLVRARSRIQAPLLDLYRFGRGKGDGPFGKTDAAWLSAFNLLVGAAFSLWRAAFLSDVIRKRSVQAKGAMTLLEAVLEDNAVTYSTDRKAKQWTGGYYLGNAKTRMAEVREKYLKGGPKTAAFMAFDALVRRDMKKYRQTDAWDVLCAALIEMVARLREI